MNNKFAWIDLELKIRKFKFSPINSSDYAIAHNIIMWDTKHHYNGFEMYAAEMYIKKFL